MLKKTDQAQHLPTPHDGRQDNDAQPQGHSTGVAQALEADIQSRLHTRVEQAFTRACVRESLQHGEENAPYRQRVDVLCTSTGEATTSVKGAGQSPAVMRPITELCAELPERVATAD
eukprot:4029463-Prymnesium_polylepis.1